MIVNEDNAVLEVRSGSIQATGESGQLTSRGVILKTTADRLARFLVPVTVEGGSVEAQEGGLSFNSSLSLNGTTLNVARDATLTIRSDAVAGGGEVRVSGDGNVALFGNTASWTVPEDQTLSTAMGGETFVVEGGTMDVAGTWVNTGPLEWRRVESRRDGHQPGRLCNRRKWHFARPHRQSGADYSRFRGANCG